MSTQLYMRTPAGALQTVISNFSRLEYMRAENKTGWLTLDLDPNSVNTGLFTLDTRLETWRQVGAYAPYLDGETVFFVRKWGWKIDSSGRELFHIEAKDANYLLDGTNIAFASGSTSASMTAAADNMIKSIAALNWGGGTHNDLSAYLTIQASVAAAPSITKEFSHRQMSTVCQDICSESFQQGTYLCYDMVYTGPTVLELRTYTGQRGINHGKASGQTVTISRERGNLVEPEFYEDHSAEFTYIYAGGQGTGADRTIKTAAATITTPFNRRELFVDARNTSTDNAIQSEANAALRQNRARRVLTGKIVDTPGCIDGVNYRWGDVVYGEYRGQGFDGHIDTMQVTIENGRETRTNQFRAEA
jgi:hypothetical protein